MRAALAAAVLALAGCSVLHNPHAGPVDDAWLAARVRNTREAQLYDRFETHAMASATWQSAEVRGRRVDQVATWQVMSSPERSALAATEAAEAARWEEFLVAFFTTDARDNDLDAPKSIWRVALVVEGQPDRLPVEVKAVRVTGLLRDLYPYIHEYDTVYRVRFERRDEQGKPLVLRIAGSEGQMDFRFGPERP